MLVKNACREQENAIADRDHNGNTVFIFEFIQAILCFKSILVKKNAILERKK